MKKFCGRAVGQPAEEDRAQYGAGEIGAAGRRFGIGEMQARAFLSAHTGRTAKKVTSQPSRIPVMTSAAPPRCEEGPRQRSSRAGNVGSDNDVSAATRASPLAPPEQRADAP